MKEQDSGLKHRDLTQKIIGVFYEVYNELGHGFLESVYETAFEMALVSKGMDVLTQIEVPVWFRGNKIGDFSADMLVEKTVLLELKGGSRLDPAHEAQLLNYLRLLRSRLAYFSVLDSSLSSNGWSMTILVRNEETTQTC